MTQQEIAAELLENFEAHKMLDESEGRYTFLIEEAKGLPPFPAEAKTEENRVHGCQSTVWMIANPKIDDGGVRIEFLVDSNSVLTRGTAALIRKLYSGQTPQDILAFDIQNFLAQLELDQSVSVGRRNGLEGMVKRVKTLAREYQTQ